MNLDLTEEQKLIQDTARDFAKAELEPLAAKLDQEGDRATFLANLKKLAELGFMGLNVKDEYGGSEAGVIAFSVAMTEIARACASTAVTVSVNNMVCEVIQAIGTEEQKKPTSPRSAPASMPPAASASPRPAPAPTRPACAPTAVKDGDH